MTTRTITIASIATAILLSILGTSIAGSKREEKPRFKGVELYSWKVETDTWVFVMLTGTNRLKSEDEIKNSKGRIEGVGALKRALAKLAVNEELFWAHRVEGFDFPPQAIKDKISAAAKKAEINLWIADGGDSQVSQTADRGHKGSQDRGVSAIGESGLANGRVMVGSR